MHGDLPATKVRGYTDLVADPSGPLISTSGPMILAVRNRPVRVLFQNNLAPGGKLSVPVDTTYMGAGMVADNVATAPTRRTSASVIHLHGGNTPWISDGTPHQWITPVDDTVSRTRSGFAKGFSTQNVPDMPAALGFTPSLTDGRTTFYWTNQQSGRLMFYHDHAYGITRLNVYAGEAAGYLLVDPAAGERAGRGRRAGHDCDIDPVTNATFGRFRSRRTSCPLVIQDKTFVPDDGGRRRPAGGQDPTWDMAKWGGAGDLWFPHVYTPNQNPADITGRQRLRPLGLRPVVLAAAEPGDARSSVQPYACTSAAYPGGAGLAFPPLMCPGTPLPSGTPEAFMDTPVVNGTAYPTLTVDPAAYRFQVLNAANDRTLNLGLYVAEPVTLSR